MPFRRWQTWLPTLEVSLPFLFLTNSNPQGVELRKKKHFWQCIPFQDCAHFIIITLAFFGKRIILCLSSKLTYAWVLNSNENNSMRIKRTKIPLHSTPKMNITPNNEGQRTVKVLFSHNPLAFCVVALSLFYFASVSRGKGSPWCTMYELLCQVWVPKPGGDI